MQYTHAIQIWSKVGLMRITDTASELHISVGLNVLLVGFIFAAS